MFEKGVPLDGGKLLPWHVERRQLELLVGPAVTGQHCISLFGLEAWLRPLYSGGLAGVAVVFAGHDVANNVWDESRFRRERVAVREALVKTLGPPTRTELDDYNRDDLPSAIWDLETLEVRHHVYERFVLHHSLLIELQANEGTRL